MGGEEVEVVDSSFEILGFEQDPGMSYAGGASVGLF